MGWGKGVIDFCVTIFTLKGSAPFLLRALWAEPTRQPLPSPFIKEGLPSIYKGVRESTCKHSL
jgi:hypothetical protein